MTPRSRWKVSEPDSSGAAWLTGSIPSFLQHHQASHPLASSPLCQALEAGVFPLALMCGRGKKSPHKAINYQDCQHRGGVGTVTGLAKSLRGYPERVPGSVKPLCISRAFSLCYPPFNFHRGVCAVQKAAWVTGLYYFSCHSLGRLVLPASAAWSSFPVSKQTQTGWCFVPPPIP